MTPLCEALTAALVGVLNRVCANPVDATFNHFLFECAAILIRVSGTHGQTSQNSALLTSLQGQLLPTFELVLSQDVQDLSPYVFQLLAQILELQTERELSPTHVVLLPLVLQPHLWERAGSIPALVRLVRAFLKKGGEMLIQPTPGSDPAAGEEVTPLMGMLGVFQKLNSTKLHDHEGFYILESMVEHLPLEWFASYLPQILTLVFTRLSNPRMKTDKFVRSFLLFLCLFIGKHGADEVVAKVSALQAGLFEQLLSSVFVPHVSTIRGRIERKMAAIALSRLLFECNALLANLGTEMQQTTIQPLTLALLELLQHPLEPPERPEDNPDVSAASSDGRVTMGTGGSARFTSARGSALAAANASSMLASESDIEAPRAADVGASIAGGAGGFHAFTAGFGGNAYARLVFAETESPDPFVTIDAKQFAATAIHGCSRQYPGTLQTMITVAVGEEGHLAFAGYGRETPGLEEPLLV